MTGEKKFKMQGLDVAEASVFDFIRAKKKKELEERKESAKKFSEKKQEETEKSEEEVFIEKVEAEQRAFTQSIDKIKKILTTVSKEEKSQRVESTEGKPLTANEIKNMQNELLSNAENLLSMHTISQQLLQKGLEKIQSKEIKSEDDIEEINRVLDSMAVTHQNSQESRQTLKEIRQRIEELNISYCEAKLKESGFKSFEEIREADRKVDYELYQKSTVIGQVIHKKRIDELKTQRGHLQFLSSLAYHRTTLPTIPYLEEKEIEEQTSQMIEKVVEKVINRYSSQLEKMTIKEPQSEQLFDKQMSETLDQDFVKKFVLPILELKKATLEKKVQEHSTDRTKKDLEEFTRDSKSVPQTVQELLKYSTSKLSTPEEIEKYKQLEQEISSSPFYLKSALYPFYQTGRGPSVVQYQKIREMVQNTGEMKKVQQLDVAFRETLSKLDYLVGYSFSQSELGYRLIKARWKIESQIKYAREMLKQDRNLQRIDQLTSGFDFRFWEVFRENRVIYQHLGFSEKEISSTDDFLSRLTLSKFSSGFDDASQSFRLAQELLSFKDEKVAPIAILDFYRQHRENDPEFVKYVESLDSTRFEQMPELLEIVQLIKEHPRDFHLFRVENPQFNEFMQKLSEDDEFIDFFGQNRNFLPVKKYIVKKDLEDEWGRYNERDQSLVISEAVVKSYLPDVQLPESGVIIEGETLFLMIQRASHRNHLKSMQRIEKIGPNDQQSEFGYIHREARYNYQDAEDIYKIPAEKLEYFLRKHGFDTDLFEKKEIENPINMKIRRNLVKLTARCFSQYGPEMEPFFLGCIKSQPYSELFKIMRDIQQEQGSIPIELTDGVLKFLRADDPLLAGFPERRRDITGEVFQKFRQGIEVILEELETLEKKNPDLKEYLLNIHTLRFLARQPERVQEIFQLIEKAPKFFELIRFEGPLFSNRDNILKYIFENGDLVRRAKNIEDSFTDRSPYWRQLFLFTDSRIGEQLAAATSNYPITEISGIPLKKIPSKRLQSMIPDYQSLSALASGETNSVPFSKLSGMCKRLVFRDYLRRTIDTSRSKEARMLAESVNRSRLTELLVLKPGMYLHGSAIDFLEQVLLNGNLPHEALGEGAATDTFPFQVDFTRLQEALIKEQISTDKIIDNSPSQGYGAGGSLGREGQVFYVYDREHTQWEKDKEYGPYDKVENHTLILGGMPSTEISAIVLRSPKTTLERTKLAITEHNSYIPVYDMEGKLLFRPEEYDVLLERVKPYRKIEDFLKDESYLTELDKPQAGGHRFTLKEHLLRVTDHASELAQNYGLSKDDIELVKLAGRLHDIGKTAESAGTQWFDNPLTSIDHLRQIRELSHNQVQEVLFLIQHDELLGDILQGRKDKSEFFRLFKSERERKMLMALYRADVWEIDGEGEHYRTWQIDERIKQLGLS